MNSTPQPAAADDARGAYDALASAYDVLAADYAHDRWIDEIQTLIARHDVAIGTAFDVGCGTGLSFLPLIQRGWTVTACDISPRMADIARQAAGDRADVMVRDMRELGEVGAFDLITCLDDAINYLIEPDDLARTMAGFAANLAPGGVAVWDINTLVNLRRGFTSDWVRDAGDTLIVWQGRATGVIESGAVVSATIDVIEPDGDRWTRQRGTHRQRDWTIEQVTSAAADAGLRVLDMVGQHPGVRLERPADEAVHPKVLFVAGRMDYAAGRAPTRSSARAMTVDSRTSNPSAI